MKYFSPVFALANVLLITSPPALTLAQVRVLSCTVHAGVHLGTDYTGCLGGRI